MFVLIPKHFLCFRYLLSSFFLWSFSKKYCLHASFSMSVCYRFEWWVGHWQKKGKGTSGNVASGVQNRHYKTKNVQKTVWIGISRNGPYPSWSHDMRNLSSPLRFIPLERCCLLCGLLFDGLVLWSGFVFAKSVGWQCFQKLKMQNRTTKGSNNLPWFSCLTMFVLLCFFESGPLASCVSFVWHFFVFCWWTFCGIVMNVWPQQDLLIASFREGMEPEQHVSSTRQWLCYRDFALVDAGIWTCWFHLFIFLWVGILEWNMQ